MSPAVAHARVEEQRFARPNVRRPRAPPSGRSSAHPLTSVPVGLDAVTVLQPVAPGALVAGRAGEALAHTVAALEAMRPLAPVHPFALRLHAQPVAFALRPIPVVGVAAGPGISAHHLEAVRPRTRVLALPFGPGANAVPVGFAVLPAAAVGAAIVEVEPAARHSGGAGRARAEITPSPPRAAAAAAAARYVPCQGARDKCRGSVPLSDLRLGTDSRPRLCSSPPCPSPPSVLGPRRPALPRRRKRTGGAASEAEPAGAGVSGGA